LNNYAPFSAKQLQYLRKSGVSWLNVAEGGKRAGKNIVNIVAFAMALANHPDTLHLAAGVTLAAAKMNVIDSNGLGLLNIFGGGCREGRYQGKEALIVNTGSGKKVVVIAGGGLSNDAARIKGNSYGMAYITEVNECHEDFFRETLDRTLASRDRRLFFDLNPKPPGHWFYREFLDFQQNRYDEGKNPGFNYGHFTIWDNMSLSDERLRDALSVYDPAGLWYQADILGRRVAAAGRIYTSFGRESVLPEGELFAGEYERFSIGIDVGGTDATAATLVGFDRGYRRVSVIDGFYHKQGGGAGMTDDAYAAMITEKIALWIEAFPNLPARCGVFCESADKLFRQALANRLRREGIGLTVYPSYKNDGIIYRIRLINMLISQGRFRISDRMGKWIEALTNAGWSEKERANGDWRRVDDGSYPVDCLDSLEYAVTPHKAGILSEGKWRNDKRS
jgi:PBSX family phage terminase large subunit